MSGEIPQPPAVQITPEQLQAMTRDELIQALLVMLQIQGTAADNMKKMGQLLTEANRAISDLTDKNKSMEAELLVLRARP